MRPDAARSLAARLYAYAFLGDFVLLYPVYALLFADTGLSTAEISSLFAIWSISSFVLEIPSGVLADAVSRRLLLTAAPLLTTMGYALWIFAPSYPSFALGFALWGAQGALQSGALEALVYEELDRVGAAPRYPTIMGRASSAGTLAVVTATGLAAPALAVDGFVGVGIASIVAALAAAAVGASLPEHRARPRSGPPAPAGESGGDGDVVAGYVDLLRSGAAMVRSWGAVRAAVLLVPAVTAIWGSLDEYLPLLAVESGAAIEEVPLLALLVYTGMTLGGLAAGSVSRLSAPGLAVALLFAAALLAAGSLARVPAGFLLIAISFASFQALTVTADARLQAAIAGPARSTITSFAGFGTEVLVLGIFAAYAAGSHVADHPTLFAAFAVLHIPVAGWLWRARRPSLGEVPDQAAARS